MGRRADIYGPRDALMWLLSRQRVLEGKVPAEMIQQGQVDDVLAVVDRLLDGAYL